jgi:hypothetical protein
MITVSGKGVTQTAVRPLFFCGGFEPGTVSLILFCWGDPINKKSVFTGRYFLWDKELPMGSMMKREGAPWN